MLYRIIFVWVLLCSFIYANTQEFSPKKGKFFASFGWNRAWYTNSDIQFKGDHYNFTLNDVKAHDRQSKFGFDPYFHPLKFTLPQTNTKIGYFINDQYAITIGFDHMKYVMLIDQVVTIDGYIEKTNFDGVYSDDNIALERDFLTFEHTDGLNYINADIHRYDNLYARNFFELQLVEALGIGVLNPRSAVKMFNKSQSDRFHFSGYGVHGLFGLKIILFELFYFQGNWQSGYINMPDIRTTNVKVDRAKQQFFYNQLNFAFGVHFGFKKLNSNTNN